MVTRSCTVYNHLPFAVSWTAEVPHSELGRTEAPHSVLGRTEAPHSVLGRTEARHSVLGRTTQNDGHKAFEQQFE